MGSKLEKTKRKQSKERKVMKEEEEGWGGGAWVFIFGRESSVGRPKRESTSAAGQADGRSRGRRGAVGSRSVALAAAAAATAAVGGN